MDDIDGYRPVSIIPAISKIFENVLSSRLVDFLAQTNALSSRQYAYRAGHSTVSLMRDMIRCVVEACEKRQQVAILCCDLSKAFDVANHEVIAEKLRYYGIMERVHDLLVDFLRQRKQIVVGDGGQTMSDPLPTSRGVAQGSSMSNILFSLLLNDLPDAVATGELFMYADDVVSVVSAPDVELLEKRLNESASQISKWFNLNGLALNTKKTHVMQFAFSGRPTHQINVVINNIRLERVDSTVFLGFCVDRGLTWSSHIDRICAKLGSACYALSRLSRVVSSVAMRACYFATVHSVLQYGAELWARGADRERVFRMQKRAIRTIARITRDTSCMPFFKSLNIMTLPCIVIFQVATYVRENVESFKTLSDGHQYNTRKGHKLAAISHRLTKSDKLTHVMGPAVYSRLPDSVLATSSVPSFKSYLKRWLIEKSFYSVEEYLKQKA